MCVTHNPDSTCVSMNVPQKQHGTQDTFGARSQSLFSPQLDVWIKESNEMFFLSCIKCRQIVMVLFFSKSVKYCSPSRFYLGESCIWLWAKKKANKKVSLFLHLRKNSTALFSHTRLTSWPSLSPSYDLHTGVAFHSTTGITIVKLLDYKPWPFHSGRPHRPGPSSWRPWPATWWQQLGWWRSWWQWKFWSWSLPKTLTSTASVTTRFVCLPQSVCLTPSLPTTFGEVPGVQKMIRAILLRTQRYQGFPF